MSTLTQPQAQAESSLVIDWVETGLVPDALIRAGIRRLNRQRLVEIEASDCEAAAARLNDFVGQMNAAPVSLRPDLANAQHYEVPAEFFGLVLGQHRKYSACYWDSDTQLLDQAEARALEITVQRAEIRNGMRVLELGCGWGALTFWIAERFPDCDVTAVSNSRSQREFIESEARRRGLANISVLTRDMNDFDTAGRFDRVVSIEMFEHMRNYRELFARISRWLEPDGRFFMHIFCHRSTAYEFVDNGPQDWMSRHFFSGGIMPSVDLPARFQDHLRLERHWRWSGVHYQKTANAWLEQLDAKVHDVARIFDVTYGEDQARMWVARWRIFFMACAELFGHDGGQEWLVGHYLFAPHQERSR